jgi:hypothetical protein
MKQSIISIPESNLSNAIKLFDKYNIEYRLLGYPNGKIETVESFPSKMNVYNDMQKFAKQLGYKNTIEAIIEIGGGRAFKAKFDKEFKE